MQPLRTAHLHISTHGLFYVFAFVLIVVCKTLPLFVLLCLHLPFHVARDYLIWIPLEQESISVQVGRAPYFPVFLTSPSSSEVTSRNVARCGCLPAPKNVWWKWSVRAAEMGVLMWWRCKKTDTTQITLNKQQKMPIIVEKYNLLPDKQIFSWLHYYSIGFFNLHYL